MRVRRFCGFVAGGLSHRVSLEVSSGVCRVCRSKTGLSHRVSLEVSSGACRGQGSQIQEWAVAQGVVGGVIFWCVYGFAHPRQGCRHRGCHWRCHLMRVRVGVRSIIYYFWINLYLCLVITVSVFWFDQKFFYGRRCILWSGLKQLAQNRWYLSMLFGVHAGIISTFA